MPVTGCGVYLTSSESGGAGLCEYCDKEGIQFISDEIYHHISYGKKEATAMQFSKNAMIINCKEERGPHCWNAGSR